MPTTARIVSSSLDATFGALADPTRRAMLVHLARGPASVTKLGKRFPISLPAVSKHVRVLEEAGLLARARDGRVHRCSLAAEPIREAAAWMARYRRFWERQLDALDAYLGESTAKEGAPWATRPSSLIRPSPSAGRLRRRVSGSSRRGRIPPR